MWCWCVVCGTRKLYVVLVCVKGVVCGIDVLYVVLVGCMWCWCVLCVMSGVV